MRTIFETWTDCGGDYAAMLSVPADRTVDMHVTLVTDGEHTTYTATPVGVSLVDARAIAREFSLTGTLAMAQAADIRAALGDIALLNWDEGCDVDDAAYIIVLNERAYAIAL